VRAGLRALVSSHIYVLTHAFMVGRHWPGTPGCCSRLSSGWRPTPRTRGMLAGLGAPHGWQRLNDEDVYFMLDLMSALSPS